MSITASTFGAVATAAAATIRAAIPTAAVYDYAPVQGFNKFPAIWFTPPNFERHDPDTEDSQLGSRDLHLEYTLHAYVLDNATGDGGRNAEDAAAQLMGQIIGAIDNDPNLGGAALIEAIISSGEFQRAEARQQNVEGGLPVVGYEALLKVFTIA